MATYNATNYTKTLNPVSDNIVAPGTLGGRVRVLTDNITIAAAGDETIAFGKKLQAGAIILGIEISHVALGADITYEIGDSQDPNRYMDAINGNALADDKAIIQAGKHYVVGTNAGDDILLMSIRDAGVGGAAGVCKMSVFYTED